MNDELRAIERRWITWTACIHEAGHLVAAIATGGDASGAFILGPARAYSRCAAAPVVYAAGDIAVKLRAALGTQPPEGDPVFLDLGMPEIPVSDDAGTRQGVSPIGDTAPATIGPTLREIGEQAEIILRENWLPLVEIASALFRQGFIAGPEARRFMLGVSP